VAHSAALRAYFEFSKEANRMGGANAVPSEEEQTDLMRIQQLPKCL
jgi:hypothetical protein